MYHHHYEGPQGWSGIEYAEEAQFVRQRPPIGGFSPARQQQVRQSGGGQCFKCGEPGHWSRDCTREVGPADRPKRFRGNVVSCYTCGGDGHCSPDCHLSLCRKSKQIAEACTALHGSLVKVQAALPAAQKQCGAELEGAIRTLLELHRHQSINRESEFFKKEESK